jgi:hypothetical protein
VAVSDRQLSTVIGPEQGRRLRLTACVQGKPIGTLLTDLLDEHLPSITELADAIRAADDGQAGAA